MDINLHDIENITRKLLNVIEPNPKREGLKDTPKRVAQAWAEWTCGYEMSPIEILKPSFDLEQVYDSLVIVHNIPVYSHCEHHLAPIIGFAHVGYLPENKVVGLSKLARIVDCFARRLQIQERMTSEIATAIHYNLDAKATGVIIRAQHMCMASRGVNIAGAPTTTSTMLGLLKDDVTLKNEFMHLCAVAERNK